MSRTLDQVRSSLAWGYAAEGMKAHGKAYKSLAKGAPALIMNSGLMATLAFYRGKDNAAKQLLNDLCNGLVTRRRPDPPPRDFGGFMVLLQEMPSSEYLGYTDESLEILKWIRQFVDAVEG